MSQDQTTPPAGPNLSSEPLAARSEPSHPHGPFKSCPKCEAVQDVALLCGPCADRFCDHLMADPAFAAAMACWEDINVPPEARR